jgi:acyl-CoA synthetase (NDP forming)
MTKQRNALKELLSARTVAVVGASSDPRKITGRPIDYMLERGFAGEIIPVNPGRAEVQGLRSYSSLAAIGRPVDLAIVGTASELVEDVIREGVAAGVRGFVVFSSGFAEHNSQGAARQARLGALARRHGVTIVGPNCLGVINCETGLVASFTTAMEENALKPGGFGFASQSGALGAYWLDRVLQAGVGISKWITTGNECDVDIARALGVLVDDSATRVIGAYIEDVKDGTAFRNALRDAAAVDKPVLLIKAGRSSAGAAAAASHTGAIVGEDAVYQACFDQFGAVRVGSLNEMIDVARLVLHDAVPSGDGVGVLSVSGGAGVLLADAVEAAGLSIPAFRPQTAKALGAYLPSFSKPQNPVDLTANVLQDTAMFGRALAVIGAAEEIDVGILFIGLMHSISEELAGAILAARRASGMAFVVVWIGARPDVVARLDAAGIPVFPDIPQAVTALTLARRAATSRAVAARLPDAPAARSAPGTAVRLTEWESKNVLRAGMGAGGSLALPDGVLIRAGEAVGARIAGLSAPYVAKLQSPDLPHKSDRGGVIVGLADLTAVEGAVDLLRGRAAGLPVDGVLVEEMTGFDVELIAGLRRDPVFGPLLVVGRGGVEVELAPDVAMRLLPLRSEDIAAMLRSLRCAALFGGFRGRAAVDVDSIAGGLAALAARFLSDESLVEIEINPLVARGGGATALDALLTVRR